MPDRKPRSIQFQRIELDGVRYVILRESAFERLCRQANVDAPESDAAVDGVDLDRASLAEKLSKRRRATGLTQAALARRAGVRPETLNRIERGRTTPDFRTVRKLVVALNAAEREQAAPSASKSSIPKPPEKESP